MTVKMEITGKEKMENIENMEKLREMERWGDGAEEASIWSRKKKSLSKLGFSLGLSKRKPEYT